MFFPVSKDRNQSKWPKLATTKLKNSVPTKTPNNFNKIRRVLKLLTILGLVKLNLFVTVFLLLQQSYPRQYSNSYLPDVPSTTPESVIYHDYPVMHANIVNCDLASDEEASAALEETKTVLAKPQFSKITKPKGRIPNGSLRAGGLHFDKNNTFHDGDGRVQPKPSPNFMVCHSAPTASRRHPSPAS